MKYKRPELEIALPTLSEEQYARLREATESITFKVNTYATPRDDETEIEKSFQCSAFVIKQGSLANSRVYTPYGLDSGSPDVNYEQVIVQRTSGLESPYRPDSEHEVRHRELEFLKILLDIVSEK